jgi:hypothetical protein
MEVPRPRSRVDKNARRVLGGDDARAMAMATRARMTTAMDDGEGVTESVERETIITHSE